MFVLNVIGKGASPGTAFLSRPEGRPVILSAGDAFDLAVHGRRRAPDAGEARERWRKDFRSSTSILSPPAIAARSCWWPTWIPPSSMSNAWTRLADMAGLEAENRRHHRTCHARRNRVRGGVARARGVLKGLPLSRWKKPMPNACGSIPAPKAFSPPCARMAPIPCWSRAALAFSPGGSRKRRDFMSSRQHACWMTARP
jgi:hypothetical protein